MEGYCIPVGTNGDWVAGHGGEIGENSYIRGMFYVFVINGRKDKEFILPEIQAQIAGLDIASEIYVTTAVGDATRFVRLYCSFKKDHENLCFVACGGCGTANEVASACAGFPKVQMAVMEYGFTNDFLKSYPGRNFKSVKALVEGEVRKTDIIKCNNDYALNVANFGFDASVAYFGGLYSMMGKSRPFQKGIVKSILKARRNHFVVKVDGRKVSRFLTLQCAAANGKYYGGEYCCAPEADTEDGLIDFVFVYSCTLLSFLAILPHFKRGDFLQSAFCRRRMLYMKAKKVEITCPDLKYGCLDGEMVPSTKFVLEILPGAINLRLPR